MLLGGILEIIIHNTISPETALVFSDKNHSDCFIRLVQMIISPGLLLLWCC
jgi:hypothetical protein